MMYNIRMFGIPDALQNIRPTSQWVLSGDDYEGLNWLDSSEKPTEEEIKNEINRLNKEWQDSEYKRLRAKEYPDFREYLDGVVKGDQAQIDEYISTCLAIKQKYPKPQ